MPEADKPSAKIARIVESARRLGVELDEDEALQWLAAMAAGPGGGTWSSTCAPGSSATGSRMLDFSPRISTTSAASAAWSSSTTTPGVVETALALSGSAAQSKIQTLPRRLRLLRAGQHHRRHPRRGLRHPRRA